MKKLFMFFSVMLFVMMLQAQPPQAIKYQAIARSLNGDPVINQDIAVKISILQGNDFGPVVYSELHETATNAFGLFNLEIGNPVEVLSGNFSEIGWRYFSHFLKIEIDITGGLNFQLMGVSQFVSVPYALYAQEAGNAQNFSAGPGISINNGVISNTAPDKTVTVASGNGISASGTYPNFMITNTNPDQTVSIISGTGISATGTYPNFTVTNTSPDQNVTLASGYGITATGTYPNFTITNAKPNATHTGDASGTTELTVTGIQGRNISNQAPTLNQVYKWDGTRWMPSTLAPYTAGTGIDITDNIVTNTSPDQNVTITSGTGISVSGTYPGFTITNAQPNATHTGDATGGSALSVVKIQGRPVSSTVPASNQVLQWNGSAWTPTTLETQSEDWKLTGNSGTSPATHFIGTTDNAALQFKVSNVRAGWIEKWYGSNTCFGYESLRDVTTGKFSTALGYLALRLNTEGDGNTALGDQSLKSNTIGNYNTAGGYVSMTNNSTGSGNSSFGWASVYDNTSGSFNSGFGYLTLANNTTGNSNVAFGVSALHSNTIKSNLVAIGDSALYKNGQGALLSYESVMNTAVGSKAMYANTTGYSNSAVGSNALYSNSSGVRNNAFGRDALNSNTDGNDNIGIGCFSMQNNSSGDYNIAIGNHALQNSTIGTYNAVVGHYALYSNSDGNENSALGINAMYGNTTGDMNTAVGKSALYNNTTGNYNTAVGAESGFAANQVSNTTSIGYQAGSNMAVSNRVAIGNTSVTWIGGQVNWSIYSDERIKDNVKEDVAGLDFISKLRPVTYNLNIHRQNEMFNRGGQDTLDWPEKYDIENIRMTGFIAQEVEKAAIDAGYNFSGIEKPNEGGLYSLRYSDFVVPLVKALQEQQLIIDKQQNQIDTLIKRIEILENK